VPLSLLGGHRDARHARIVSRVEAKAGMKSMQWLTLVFSRSFSDVSSKSNYGCNPFAS
jgi:hypothetical protein